MKQQPSIMSLAILSLLFIAFIIISFNNDGLFLKEMTISSLIIGLVFLISQKGIHN